MIACLIQNRPSNKLQKTVISMAEFKDLETSSRRYIDRYPFPELNAPAFTLLRKPLADSKIAIVTTAGLHTKDDKPFSTSFASSDSSFRLITSDTNRDEIKISHTSKEFDRSGVEKDLNIVLPFDRLRELVEQKKLGAIAPRHFSFMGSLPRTGALKKETAPQVANLLIEDGVDIVLLTPV